MNIYRHLHPSFRARRSEAQRSRDTEPSFGQQQPREVAGFQLAPALRSGLAGMTMEGW